MALISKDILQAKKLLEEENIVAIPTETVYGLAGNTFAENSLVKIFEAKNRPFFDPLISHTSDWKRTKDFVLNFPEQYLPLIEAFPKGALTLLLPKKNNVPDLATSGLPHVAVRVPDHDLTLSLLDKLDFPLSAPSANPFGYISPTTAQHVEAQLGEKIPFILDGGACEVGIESTIIGLENGELTIFRLGGIAIEHLENILNKKLSIKIHQSSNPKTAGQLDSHYAPRKPLYLIKNYPMTIGDKITIENLGKFSPKNVGFLGFSDILSVIPLKNQFILSENNDFAEASKRLFAGLRYLDELPLDIILAELAPNYSLGRAINDRLVRASYKV